MEVLVKILRVIFNPLSLIQKSKQSNEEADFLSRFPYVIASIAVLITAVIMLLVHFVF